MYQNKLLKPGVQTVVKRNKNKFEAYGDLFDKARSLYNANMLQIENVETGESNRNFAIPNFMPRIVADDEIVENINFLNSKQRDVFSIVHNWVKEYAKHKGVNVKAVHIFLSESGATGKSHLVKTIYNAVAKNLLLSCKEPEKPRVFLLGPTTIS